MRRYKMEAVVRYEEQDDSVTFGGVTHGRPLRANITALSESAARRALLERAWGQQMLVARIDVLDVVEV